MKLTQLTPMLQTDDLKVSIEFYTEILGFTCDAYEPGWGWASLQKDDITIMLAKPNQHLPYQQSHLTGSLYMLTDDVNGWWHKLNTRTEIVYPIENFEYGMREFAIKDCNGYILQFGQSISQE